MVQTVWLTQAGKSRLEEELQDLRTRRRPELHARIQEATESGDISDNSEYEELKDEWASLEARIFELEQTLDRAEIIQPVDDGLKSGRAKIAQHRIVSGTICVIDRGHRAPDQSQYDDVVRHGRRRRRLRRHLRNGRRRSGQEGRAKKENG